MGEPISVVVPARNEAGTIAQVVAAMAALPDVAEVVVVANASTDDTAARAAAAGARVMTEATPGMGAALRTGLAAARHDWILKVDGDLARFDTAKFASMAAARGPGIGLVKGVWADPQDDMPMTRVLVAPAVRLLAPGLADLRAPNSGLYLFDRRHIFWDDLHPGYAADIDVMLRMHAAGARVIDTRIGRIRHDSRSPAHYGAMAETILAFFMQLRDALPFEPVLVVAPDAEAVIRGCLGLLARRARAGGRVTVSLQDDGDSPARAALDAALAPFPTARVGAAALVHDWQPGPAAAAVCVVLGPGTTDTPLPDTVRAGGIALRRLRMPARDEAARADRCGGIVSLDPGNGAGVKRAALARIGAADPAAAAMPELFIAPPDTPDIPGAT